MVAPLFVLLWFQSTPSGGKATGLCITAPTMAGVSIHAFRGEGDPSPAAAVNSGPCSFQSTPSGGKATRRYAPRGAAYARFNPRLPGGRRQITLLRLIVLQIVSIHAFRGEGDTEQSSPEVIEHAFQSTPSGGKATLTRYLRVYGQPLFQSTPSGGKATIHRLTTNPITMFQSTPSGGKATAHESLRVPGRMSFNPRLPGGRRHQDDELILRLLRFNPRLPGGRRRGRYITLNVHGGFQSTPSGGKATLRAELPSLSDMFQSTPSGGKATKRRGK